MGTIETLTVGLATAAVLAIAIYAGVEFKRRLIRQPVRIDDEQKRIAQRNRFNRR
ncbi:hypothetical protein L861_22515 [Litchfieldella anticariensis FP35 = DSM 16096]|uniref:Uncharacterized protein n=1 Tax=Litchfieldella anticariensis (strain DSM 16096 / CECT 5854 / CIP 108499 / LMG 22089 / FP35) TaxID=1121939 RepID=S2LE98_LITA3|nr:hypothetical protein [Halomonas anticariensis]EPC03086.1 hypothetical protein L861_22515 [Halomonas anticariensis FP35 = DSM 16096]